MSVDAALEAYFESAREVNDLIAGVARAEDGDSDRLQHELDAARERRAQALESLRDAGQPTSVD